MAAVFLLLAAVGVTLGLPTNSLGATNAKGKVDPTPCNTALEWEGRCSQWDHVAEFNNRFLISFDAKNQRKRLMEEKKSYMPGHRYVEYLQFYQDKVEYQIDHTYNVCKTLPLGTFRNHSIPYDAILEDQYDVGQPGHSILAQEWSDRVTGRKKEEWIGVFTTKEEGCWPMFEIYSKDEDNKSISYSTRFFNLSSGIKDPSVFAIPAICKKASFAGMPAVTLTDAPTIPSEVQPTDVPGLFGTIKAWMFGRKNGRSDKILRKVGLVNRKSKKPMDHYKVRYAI